MSLIAGHLQAVFTGSHVVVIHAIQLTVSSFDAVCFSSLWVSLTPVLLVG